MYEADLTLRSMGHSEALFSHFAEISHGNMHPEHGSFIYIDGKVRCNIHPSEGENLEEEDEDGGVPFL
ncbi:hypothetical protein ACFQ3N_01845 [Virgibacillus byunsanensis]|uniref:Uncharacterized protein n=2 Tax=Virgibacillus byunsanensis TaxID=570945 RepID=A0ABW3LFN9_9BACI